MEPVVAALEERGANIHLTCPAIFPAGTAKRAGAALARVIETLTARLKTDRPDLLLGLGDRYEILGTAQVATLFKIPIAHIHGGETSKGSYDDRYRDAITRLSDIHFVAAHRFRERVIQLGADPRKVFVVGAPGLDNMEDLPERSIKGDYFVVAYHSATAVDEAGEAAILEAFDSFPGYGAVWVGTNTDPGAEHIHTVFYGADSITRSGTMDVKNYLSLVKHAAVCVGNSSSFLIEAPALGTPTVNVGYRQRGRLKGPSVINCAPETAAVIEAIKQAVTFKIPQGSPAYKSIYHNPYGGPGASAKIAGVLLSDPLPDPSSLLMPIRITGIKESVRIVERTDGLWDHTPAEMEKISRDQKETAKIFKDRGNGVQANLFLESAAAWAIAARRKRRAA